MSCQTEPWRGTSAIVTGASRGIGRAVAVELAGRGTHLGLLARDLQQLERVAAECRAAAPPSTPEPTTLALDLTEHDRVRAELPIMIDHLGGRLHLLANVAGAAVVKDRLEHVDLDGWASTLDINLLGPALLQQVCFSALAAARGAIVNVGSVVAGRAAPLSAPYAASKAALASLTRSTALEWARHGIRAMTIEPGYVPTDFNESLISAGLEERLLARVPTGEPVDPESIARAVAFVGSPEQTHLTGDTLRIDGGYSVRLG